MSLWSHIILASLSAVLVWGLHPNASGNGKTFGSIALYWLLYIVIYEIRKKKESE